MTVNPSEPCVLWPQSVGSHGYGQTFYGGKVMLAHRVAWMKVNGPIPLGLVVDHVCHVRRCVNVNHLRLLTNVENSRDNGQGDKTHCPWGHPYAGDNLYVMPATGHRRCRACAREAHRKDYEWLRAHPMTALPRRPPLRGDHG